MIDRVVLKKGDMLIVETPSPLPDKLVIEITSKLKESLPDGVEVFMPNGAKLTVVSAE